MNMATVARGIRLPEELWEAIDREAASVSLSRNDFLCRKLSWLFLGADAQKMSARAKDTAPVEFAK